MKMNPRTSVVNAAHSELAQYICELIEKHGLTYCELFFVLTQEQMAWAANAVKEERKDDEA